MRRIPMHFKTAADGSATVDIPRVFGEIVAILVNTALNQTVDLTLSDHTRSETIVADTGLADGAVITPAAALVDATNTVIDDTGDGVYGRPVVMGTLRAVIASGGNAKRGVITVLVNG